VSLYHLDRLFAPTSVALVGASPRQGSVGLALLENLCTRGFAGPVYAVNPHHSALGERPCYQSIDDLPAVPDVVMIVAPINAVHQNVAAAARRGVPAVILVTAGLPESLADDILGLARNAGLRLVGPGCLGVVAPHARFDASLTARAALPGRLALVSQSTTVAAGMLAWATSRGIGFSAALSLGGQLDVDFGDCLDFFSQDRLTRAILLYVETIKDTRKFMSAARAAARSKPVLVIKSGRYARPNGQPSTHAATLASPDDVYSAAMRRAGLLRVYDLEELFAAAESLARVLPFQGERVAVLGNGHGIGALAADRILDFGGELAQFDDEARIRLDAMGLPGQSFNPLNIGDDGASEAYAEALEVVLADKGTDAVLVLNSPNVLVSSQASALAVAGVVAKHRKARFPAKPAFAVWIGDRPEASAVFDAESIPHYETEADAVRGIMHLIRYRRAQTDLMKTPPSLPADFSPDVELARRIVTEALAAGRRWLTPADMIRLLTAYAIPVAPVATAMSAEAAAEIAGAYFAEGSAVALKILSQDILHKSDVGGVVLNLANQAAVIAAANAMLAQVRTLRPLAEIDGFAVQPMVQRSGSVELMAGFADDPVFGPIVVFGRGGTAVETIADKALALPPLDLRLAREMIERTRVNRLLRGYRDVPPADIDAVALVLVKLAQLAADVSEIRELDLNPIVANADGLIVVDSRALLAPLDPPDRHPLFNPRFAIKPYPSQWERQIALRDGSRVFVRPVRPEDEALYEDFFAAVTPEDLRLRFFAAVKDRSHAFVARLTQLDYERAMALAAIEPQSRTLLGVVRLHLDSDRKHGEYAILLRSNLKGRGLGWELMQLIIEYARAEGVQQITGQVLRENSTMLAMCQKLGFRLSHDSDDREVMLATLDLGAGAPP
jgi:acetyltransferase